MVQTIPLTIVKQDPDASLSSVRITSIKPEHVANSVKQEKVPVAIPQVTSHPCVLTYVENGNEVTEILSSEDEMEVDSILKIDNIGSYSSDTLIDQATAYSDDSDSQSDLDISSTPDIRSSDYDMSDSDSELEAPVTVASTTMWLDPNISSKVTYSQVQLTRQRSVECIEEVFGGIPTYWPVPRDNRAFLIKLEDPKYNVLDAEGELMTVDGLIKNMVCASCDEFSLNI